MRKFFFEDISQVLPETVEVFGGIEGTYFNSIKSLDDSGEHSLVWCSPDREDKQQAVENTLAAYIICDPSIKISQKLLANKVFLVVKNPKLVFTRILRSIMTAEFEPGIHDTSTIHPEAVISKTAHIGPNCYIGKCTIGEYSIIHGNSFIYNGSTIGKGVVIEAGAILGAEGFGMAKTDEGTWERFPHIGGLEVGDNVEIGAGTTIDRGALGNTIIGQGTKISKSAHISHNVQIGKNCLITGCVSIAGSTKIGDNVWISPNATLLNKLNIGNNVFISIGATVSQDIKDNHKAIGRKILPN